MLSAASISRAGSAFGSCRSTLAMFAWPGADLTLDVEARAVGFAGAPLGGGGAASERTAGLCSPRPRTGRQTLELAPCAAAIVAPTPCWAQLVGLSMNPGRLTSTLIVRSRSCTPSTYCGNGSEVIVNAAVVAVHRDRGPDHDGTEVERSRHRGHDDRQAERLALVRAGQIHLATEIERVRPGARTDGRRPDQTFRAARAGVRLRFRALWNTRQILPSSPGGVLTVIPEMSCSRSSRPIVTENGLDAPAVASGCRPRRTG